MNRRQDLEQLIRDLTTLARSRPDEALRRCRAILAQVVNLVPLLVLAARIERQTGHPQEAERLLKRALDADPEAGPAYGELGMLAAARGAFDAAAGYFGAWTRCQPSFTDPWFNLGLAEERRGRFADAADAYRQALAVASGDDADIRLRLAGVLAMAGRESDARAHYRSVFDSDGDNLDARFGLGLIDLAEGEVGAAEAAFRACVERSPEFAEAWQQILAMRRITDPDDPDLLAVRDLLERPSLTPLNRERLSFAIAKALDDLGQYDDAFVAVSTANELKRARLPPFDADAWRAKTERHRVSLLDELPATTGSDRPLPAFVVGMPRSGTTLVDQILSAHPLAAGLGESAFLDEVVYETSSGPSVAERLLAARDRYLSRLGEADAIVVSNKYPANFLHLPLIWRLFADARVVHVTRSALDTCLSIFFQDFPTGNLYANSLVDIAAYYRQYRRLMEHIDDRPGLLHVAYEELLADQEGVSRRILAHCDLSWDEACLDYASNRRPVGTLSRWQVRQPLYRSSVGRWRQYRDHLAPLIEALGDYADVD